MIKSEKQIKSSPDYHDYDHEYQDIHEEDVDNWLNISKQEYRVDNKVILKAEGDSATRTVTEILDPSCELKVGDSVNDFSSNKDYLDDVYNGNFVITSTKSKENNMKDDIVLSGLDMNKSSLNTVYRKPIKSSADLYDFTYEDEDGFDRHAFYAEENNGSFEVTDRDPQYKEVRIGDIITVADAKDMGLEWKEVLTSSRKLIKSSNKTVIRQGPNLKTLDETPAEHIMKNLDAYKGYTRFDMEELVLNPSGYTLYDGDKRHIVYKKDGAEDITLLFRNDGELKDVKITSSRKSIKSGKKSVTRRQIEDELDRVLEKNKISLSNEVYKETVDYILSFWDDDFDDPKDVEEAIHEWYLDTKKNFPDVFTRGRRQRVASSLYLRYIKSSRR